MLEITPVFYGLGERCILEFSSLPAFELLSICKLQSSQISRSFSRSFQSKSIGLAKQLVGTSNSQM